MKQKDLIPHLFRTEYGKITAVLCRQFGLDYVRIAEDLASETFAAALETWPYHGVPANPTAWLYTVAKNKARNWHTRQTIFRDKVAPREAFLQQDTASRPEWSENHIADSQLRMLFAICHPAIPRESQIGLALSILCGFGPEELADAFLAEKETVSKRLYRAREKLRKMKELPECLPGKETQTRLQSVLLTLYLLFNEGYYSQSDDAIIRKDLCLEAMRLAVLLLGNKDTASSEAHALLALMCFHTSRFDARCSAGGSQILYEDQDESLWNQELIGRGFGYLQTAAEGNRLNRYYLEASIACWYTQKADTLEKWQGILQAYNRLLVVEYSAMAALNRTYAFSRVHGKEAGLQEALKLNLSGNPYYHSLLGYLYTGRHRAKAKTSYQRARALVRTRPEKRLLQKRIVALENESEEG